MGRYRLAEGDGIEQVGMQITPWLGHLYAGRKNELKYAQYPKKSKIGFIFLRN